MSAKDEQKRWIEEYIKGVNVSDIEWIVLDAEELKMFFADNYYDNKCDSYVKESNLTPIQIPIGMSYLAFNYISDDFKHLLGVVPNNIGKKTIVGCLMYLEECYLFEEQKNPVTYVLSVEVNSHFRNKCIFKRMAEQFMSNINGNQHLIISNQSPLGKEFKVFGTINNIAKASLFKKQVLCNDYTDNSQLRKVICDNNYSYVKKNNYYRSS